MSDIIQQTAGIPVKEILDRNQNLSGALRRYRIDAENANKALREAERTIKALTAERDSLAANSDVKALTAQIRGLKHRQAFDQIALKAGADPAKLGDLWDLSKVQADSDEPDMEAMGKLVAEQKKSRGWAFGQQQQQQAPPPNPDTLPNPAPGSGQGGGQASGTTYGPEHYADAKFFFRNHEKMAAYAKERVVRGEV